MILSIFGSRKQFYASRLTSLIRGKTPLGQAVRRVGLAIAASSMIVSCGGKETSGTPSSPPPSQRPADNFEWVVGKREALYEQEPYRYVFKIGGKEEVVAFGANSPGTGTFCVSRQQSGDNRGFKIAVDGTPSITARGLTEAECNQMNSQSFVAPSIGERDKTWQTKHVV
jgi:hypothetical protein